MAEVEILMGTRNGARFLGPQLASIAAQGLEDWTLTISDDGSSDASQEIAARFGAARPDARVRIRTGPRRGASANYLALLAGAGPAAAMIALSDQDDIWFPDRLARGAAMLRARPAARPVLYAARTVLVDAAARPLRTPMRRAPRPSFANALVENVVAGNTIMMNRTAADLAARVQPRTLPPFHDWWLYALMTGIGAEIVIDERPVLAYRQHRDGLIGAHSGAAARLARIRLIARGTWRDWLHAHHAALASVAPELLSEHRARLAALTVPGGNRLRAFAAARARRQSRAGTAALTLAALAGFA